MSDDHVVVASAWPTLSRPIKWVGILAPWFFGTLFAADALGVTGPEANPSLGLPALILAIIPGAIFVLARWLGRIPWLRWMHASVQPRLTIAAEGLTLQLPASGVRRITWDEIDRLRMRPNGRGDLLGPDGDVVAQLPDSLMMAGGSWWRSESVASLVVRRRPDLFKLSGANWAGEPNEFARSVPGAPGDVERAWAWRRRATNVGLLILMVLMVLVFALQVRGS